MPGAPKTQLNMEGQSLGEKTWKDRRWDHKPPEAFVKNSPPAQHSRSALGAAPPGPGPAAKCPEHHLLVQRLH